MSKIYPVILSGGSGTRLWPVSRAELPKQLQRLVGDRTMIQETALRTHEASIYEPPTVICGAAQASAVREQLAEVEINATTIVEPFGRNTAPAAAVVSAFLKQQDEDALVFMLPADHHIEGLDRFHDAVQIARRAAEQELLVTFGVVPSDPKTGYGYIQSAESLGDELFRVQEFKEKPDAHTAREYVDSGNYYWNSGMFLFSAKTFLAELERFAPKIVEFAEASLDQANRTAGLLELDADAFAQCPSDSIDYAVMEHTTKAAVVPARFTWSDVGAWDALWEIQKSGKDDNVLEGDVVASDVKSCFIHSSHRLVAAVGLENTIVVETADAVLVARLGNSEMVKSIVDELKESSRRELVAHSARKTAYGSQSTVVQTARLTVRTTEIEPGCKWQEVTSAEATTLLAGLTSDLAIRLNGESAGHGSDLTLAVPVRTTLCVENEGAETAVVVSFERSD